MKHDAFNVLRIVHKVRDPKSLASAWFSNQATGLVSGFVV